MIRRAFLAAGILAVPLGVAALGRKTGLTVVGDTDAAPTPPASVAVSAFGTDGTALQRAIDSGARRVNVDIDVAVRADVTLRPGQTLVFAGGRLVVEKGATFVTAVLSGTGPDIAIVAPVIDARATPGVAGIALRDSDRARITGGKLVRANLMIGSHQNHVPRAIAISGLDVDMDGWRTTAIYVSGVRGVTIVRAACRGGKEGLGIYNGARAIEVRDTVSHDHTQDGFVVIAGQQVRFTGCRADNNGQSGFTTQRLIEGNDTRFVTWERCSASGNGFDGFDVRGAVDKPWNVATHYMLSTCTADANRRCGFYIVMAEGTALSDCTAARNDAQNLFVDASDDVTVRNFRSVSGATIVSSGPNKAGILVYNSRSVLLDRPVSLNRGKATQDFGLSLTGSSARARLVGGDLGGRIRATYAAVGVLAAE